MKPKYESTLALALEDYVAESTRDELKLAGVPLHVSPPNGVYRAARKRAVANARAFVRGVTKELQPK